MRATRSHIRSIATSSIVRRAQAIPICRCDFAFCVCIAFVLLQAKTYCTADGAQTLEEQSRTIVWHKYAEQTRRYIVHTHTQIHTYKTLHSLFIPQTATLDCRCESNVNILANAQNIHTTRRIAYPYIQSPLELFRTNHMAALYV